MDSKMGDEKIVVGGVDYTIYFKEGDNKGYG